MSDSIAEELLARLRGQVEERAVLEKAREIFEAAVRLCKEEDERLRALSMEGTSEGVARIEDAMRRKDGKFVGSKDQLLEAKANIGPRLEAVQPAHKSPDKRGYTWKIYRWKCEEEGKELELTAPMAKKHPHHLRQIFG